MTSLLITDVIMFRLACCVLVAIGPPNAATVNNAFAKM